MALFLNDYEFMKEYLFDMLLRGGSKAAWYDQLGEPTGGIRRFNPRTYAGFAGEKMDSKRLAKLARLAGLADEISEENQGLYEYEQHLIMDRKMYPVVRKKFGSFD